MINDHLFLQLLNCSLKARYYWEEKTGMHERPVYRQRNKLHLRDAIAGRYSNVEETSDSTEDALAETSHWLQKKDVVICGAVVQSGRFLTRIPILLKAGGHLKIIQIHGKLRKRTVSEILPGSKQERSLTNYLIRASYRAGVLKRQFPDYTIQSEFFFPDKNYVSGKSGLIGHKSDDLSLSEKEENAKELLKLFLKIDVTDSVQHILKNGIPEEFAQPKFSNTPLQELLTEIESIDFEKVVAPGQPVSHCASCEFRRSGNHTAGCWESNFAESSVQFPDKHVFDLIGHGNKIVSQKGEIFQENIQILDGLHSFDLMKKFGGQRISIQQRRNLQILKSRGEEVPAVWVKKGVESLTKVNFPLHFIDFEAATYALPNQKGEAPYKPVYFQFSCHTLSKSGKLVHSEWLDEDINEIEPGMMFIRNLVKIPDIYEGTLVHYSPFEKQAINNLIRTMRSKHSENSEEFEILETFARRKVHRQEERFLDLSKIIREYYYNRFMENGLGLKQVLESILICENEIREKRIQYDRVANLQINKFFGIESPYYDKQLKKSSIHDGSTAMNAWISFKCGLLTDREQQLVPKVLKEYCKLDSLSMYVIYNHLAQFDFEQGGDQNGDFILF